MISRGAMFTHNKQSCSEPNLMQCLIWNANKLWGRGYHLNLFPLLFSGCHLTRADAAALHCGRRRRRRRRRRRGEESGGGGGGEGGRWETGAASYEGWVMWEERDGGGGGRRRRDGGSWPQCDSEGCFPSQRCRARIYRKEKKEKRERTKAADTLKGFETEKGCFMKIAHRKCQFQLRAGLFFKRNLVWM